MTDDEHKALAEWLWEQYKDDIPGRAPKNHQPPVSFRQINPELRIFLSSLSAEDVVIIKGALQSYRNRKIIHGFLKRMGVLVIGALAAGAAFGDNVVNIVKSIFGAGK